MKRIIPAVGLTIGVNARKSLTRRIIKQEKMYQTEAKILFNKKIIPEHYKMCLDAPEIAQKAKPGQFVHIRVREGYNPLLRRPFSIHKSQGEKIEILYKVVGKGTQLLSRKKIGKKIDILGPLGQGFKANPGSEKVILVAGGIGVAPLYFLTEKLVSCKNWGVEKENKKQPIANDSSINKNQLDILVLLGAKTKEKVLCLKDFKNLNVKVRIATEDGSEGFKGLANELFFQFLSKELNPVKKLEKSSESLPLTSILSPKGRGNNEKIYSDINVTIRKSSLSESRESSLSPTSQLGSSNKINLICACGPTPMLKKVAELSFRYKIPCQVSLEQRMGCGIGACLGCTIKGETGYLRICRDGPVFEAKQIQWNEIVSG